MTLLFSGNAHAGGILDNLAPAEKITIGENRRPPSQFRQSVRESRLQAAVDPKTRGAHETT